MNPNNIRKLLLFLSSYIPLYVLLILKNISERVFDGSRLRIIAFDPYWYKGVNNWAIIVLSMLTVCLSVVLVVSLRDTSSRMLYTVEKVYDETANCYFNYISIYLLSCLGLSLNNITDIIVMVFLMLLIGFIYIRNEVVYMNPLLQLHGHSIYRVSLLCSNGKTFESILIISSALKIRPGFQFYGGDESNGIVLAPKNWKQPSEDGG